jgi:hypothetical protein
MYYPNLGPNGNTADHCMQVGALKAGPSGASVQHSPHCKPAHWTTWAANTQGMPALPHPICVQMRPFDLGRLSDGGQSGKPLPALALVQVGGLI